MVVYRAGHRLHYNDVYFLCLSFLGWFWHSLTLWLCELCTYLCRSKKRVVSLLVWKWMTWKMQKWDECYGFQISTAKRMKWISGEVWKMPEITELCKRATGWTEDGTVYLEGPRERKFNIPALNTGSVPYGNENVTFYLGFTFRGPVAYNVTAKL